MTVRPIIGDVSVSDKYVIVNGRDRYPLIPYLTCNICGIENRYYGNGVRKVHVIAGKAISYIEDVC